MKTILASLALFLAISAASAQEVQQPAPSPATAPSPPAPPTGVMLQKRAPTFSHWAVTITAVGADDAENTAAAGKPRDAAKPRFIRKITVTRTKNIVQEQILTPDGQRRETWHVGSIIYTIAPSATEPLEIERRSAKQDGTAEYFSDFAKTDFPGFEWIGAAQYSGTSKVMGRDCLIFRKDVHMLSDEQLEDLRRELDGAAPEKLDRYKQAAVACVDLETRLPLLLRVGKELRVYEFGVPPSAALEPPAAIRDAIATRGRQVEQMARMPNRPY